MRKTRFTSVLFDAYGTLVNLSGRHAECVRKILETEKGCAREASEGPAAARVRLEEEFHAYWDMREHLNLLWAARRDFRQERFVTQTELNVRSLRESFERFGLEGDAESGVELWVELTRRSSLFDDVRGAISSLPEGTAVGVVSNADNYPLLDILRREGLEFDAVVTSETARAYKPSPRIFRYALKAFGKAGEETLFVGDTPDVDIPGAKAVGITAVWLDREGRGLRPGEPVPDRTIRSLSELPLILEQ